MRTGQFWISPNLLLIIWWQFYHLYKKKCQKLPKSMRGKQKEKSSAVFYHFNICMILHSLLFQEFICSLKLLVTSDSLPQTLAANAKQKLNALYSCDKEQQKYLEIVSQISQWFFGLCDTINRQVFIAKIVLYHYYIIKV